MIIHTNITVVPPVTKVVNFQGSVCKNKTKVLCYRMQNNQEIFCLLVDCAFLPRVVYCFLEFLDALTSWETTTLSTRHLEQQLMHLMTFAM